MAHNDPGGQFAASDKAWTRLAQLQVALDGYQGDPAGALDLRLAQAEIVRQHGQPPANWAPPT
jgi:hypothetical protein